MKQEEIEMQLWEFIDGNCNDADRSRITQLIAEDSAWKEKYNVLSLLHSDMRGNLETEQPSMRFTKNVMETVVATNVARATNKYINPFIVRGIAAFFILVLVSALVYAFATAKWQTVTTDNPSKHSFDLSGIFNCTTLGALLTISLVLGLVLIDGLIRKKKSNLEI